MKEGAIFFVHSLGRRATSIRPYTPQERAHPRRPPARGASRRGCPEGLCALQPLPRRSGCAPSQRGDRHGIEPRECRLPFGNLRRAYGALLGGSSVARRPGREAPHRSLQCLGESPLPLPLRRLSSGDHGDSYPLPSLPHPTCWGREDRRPRGLSLSTALRLRWE